MPKLSHCISWKEWMLLIKAILCKTLDLFTANALGIFDCNEQQTSNQGVTTEYP